MFKKSRFCRIFTRKKGLKDAVLALPNEVDCIFVIWLFDSDITSGMSTLEHKISECYVMHKLFADGVRYRQPINKVSPSLKLMRPSLKSCKTVLKEKLTLHSRGNMISVFTQTKA